MSYSELIHVSSAADAPSADHVLPAALAYLARFTGSSREHTPNPTCAVICDGALTAAWTRWPRAART